MAVHGFYLYGMWGPITDPGARVMTQRMGSELGPINMHGSPYRDYDVNTIVAEIMALPPGDIVLVAGTSLGSNNAPVVGAYVYLQNRSRIIHGLWGFQASNYGEHAGATPSYPGLTPNCLFAHLTRSDTIDPVPGIGAYSWVKAPGNTTTNLYIDTVDDVHPGDGNTTVQDKYLAEMRRVIANPTG